MLVPENRAIALSFDILMNEVDAEQIRVTSLEKEFLQAKSDLFRVITKFNKKRLEIFNAQFLVRGVLWCTKCSKLFPLDQFKYVLVVEKKSESCGYQGGDYGFKTYRNLHLVCSKCKNKVYEKHGWYGPYDRALKDQGSYYAYGVEFRDGEYYEDMKKITEKLPDIPEELFAQLSREWGIPPELGLGNQGKLVFRSKGKDTPAS